MHPVHYIALFSRNLLSSGPMRTRLPLSQVSIEKVIYGIPTALTCTLSDDPCLSLPNQPCSYECREGQCVDVSDGPFAPCKSDDDCFQEGDTCENGLCEKPKGENEDILPEPVCKEDRHCPQPSCMEDMFCPPVVCVEGQCVEEEHLCTMDVKECKDGSFVSRSGPNCEFAPCPDPGQCQEDFHCPQPPCLEGMPCPSMICVEGECVVDEQEPIGCPEDLKQCPDGSYVGRSEPDCEFDQCAPYIKCRDTDDCPKVRCMFGAPGCPEYACDKRRGICIDLNEGRESSCCKDPEPSTMECGRSGCHCCGDGEWLLGNSGPTLPTEVACGKLGPSEPCDIEECQTDRDCPVINCFTVPCPSATCVENKCVITEH